MRRRPACGWRPRQAPAVPSTCRRPCRSILRPKGQVVPRRAGETTRRRTLLQLRWHAAGAVAARRRQRRHSHEVGCQCRAGAAVARLRRRLRAGGAEPAAAVAGELRRSTPCATMARRRYGRGRDGKRGLAGDLEYMDLKMLCAGREGVLRTTAWYMCPSQGMHVLVLTGIVLG